LGKRSRLVNVIEISPVGRDVDAGMFQVFPEMLGDNPEFADVVRGTVFDELVQGLLAVVVTDRREETGLVMMEGFQYQPFVHLRELSVFDFRPHEQVGESVFRNGRLKDREEFVENLFVADFDLFEIHFLHDCSLKMFRL
jgi:hypothetical protein